MAVTTSQTRPASRAPRRVPAARSPTAMTYAISCGLGAGLMSTAAVMLLARAEGRNSLRPVNASSHWLWGPRAGQRRDASLSYTGTGAATNMAASMFWGTIFGSYLANRPPLSTPQMLRDAAAMGMIAGAVDYGLMPKSLTPGWELALSKRSVAIGLGATALGLALGGLLAQQGRR